MKKAIILFILFPFLASAFPQGRREHKYRDPFWIDYFKNGKPSIELSYGGSHLTLKNSGLDLNRHSYIGYGLIELKLGYTYQKPTQKSSKITRYKSNFLHGALISSEYPLENPSSEGPTIIRFGASGADGYGYLLGKHSSLVFYNSNGITWTRYDAGITAIPPEYTYEQYLGAREPFDKSIRFGTTTQAGIMVPLAGLLNLNLGFDRTLVFPRHLVWKHLGSVIIEAAGQELLDNFVRAIFRSTPSAVPIVSFLLKGGMSYGLYELRREKMNWPFNSAEPLLFDSFKAGLTLTF
jgi:hypothetical protein